MTEIRFGVWNMEWLNDLFRAGSSGDAVFKTNSSNARGPRGSNVGKRKEILAKALEDLNLDALLVVEGPNRTEELQLFADELAPGEWTAHVQRSLSPARPDGRNYSAQQCLGLMIRTDRGRFDRDNPLQVFDAMDPESGAVFDASEPFHHDMGEDGVTEWYRFERRPIYAELRMTDGGRFRVLGLHLKSKGIFSAYEWSRWWQMADANRERLLAQCQRMRRMFLDGYMTDPETRDIPLIVAGDINDGPGFDASEGRLKASGVETLMGDVWMPELALRNALFDTLSDHDKAKRDYREFSTTRFSDPIFNGAYHSVWIDHILYTSASRPWVRDAKIIKRMSDNTQYHRASDHYPVVATIDPPRPEEA